MTRRSMLLLSLVVTAALAVPAAAAQGPEEDVPASGTSEAFLDALARVPAAAAPSVLPLSYVDYRAVELARAGAATPASVSELLALRDADDPSAQAWFAAAIGIAAGPSGLLVELLSYGTEWPASVGFDFFDIDRALELGSPPSSGIVLVGRFQPEAIAAAHEARGYGGTPVGDRMLWCGDPGCDAGQEVDLAGRDPRVPFGGRLGRREPVAASAGDVLSSADIATLEDMLAAANGEVPTLASDPAYRGLALAQTDGVLLIQAMFLPHGTVQARLAELAEHAGTLAAVPPAEAIGILDGASADAQVLTIALAFPDEATAATAADGVVRRLGAARSLTRDVPIPDLLAERGVTSVEGRVLPATAESRAVAVIEVRAPLPGAEPDPELGALAPSSQLYRLFMDMVYTFDLLWLAPSTPAG